MQKIKYSILILLLSALWNAGYATSPVSSKSQVIQGKLIDYETGELLTGAEVKVSGTGIVVYTDFDGQFEITGLSAGEYTLEVSYISYKKRVIRNIVPAKNHEIKLHPDTPGLSFANPASLNPGA